MASLLSQIPEVLRQAWYDEEDGEWSKRHRWPMFYLRACAGQGKPFVDSPRFYLTSSGFRQAAKWLAENTQAIYPQHGGWIAAIRYCRPGIYGGRIRSSRHHLAPEWLQAALKVQEYTPQFDPTLLTNVQRRQAAKSLSLWSLSELYHETETVRRDG